MSATTTIEPRTMPRTAPAARRPRANAADAVLPSRDRGWRRALRRLVPVWGYDRLRRLSRHATLLVNYAYDRRRMVRCSSAIARGDSRDKLASLIRMDAHGLEKGLSLRAPRPWFGRERAVRLASYVREYVERYGRDDVSDGAAEILDAYVRHGRSHGTRDDDVARAVADLPRVRADHGVTGTRQVTRDDILRDAQRDLRAFFASRRSVRQFDDRPVDLALVEAAVDIARTTPSVCNRQPWRAVVLRSRPDIRRALQIQRGARGFADQVDTLIVVTSSLASFQSAGERNQCWIDGGMFAMSLVHGLHAQGLGTCCLNWSKDHRDDRRLRAALDLDDADSIIMLVAVGHLPATLAVACSERRSTRDLMLVRGESSRRASRVEDMTL